MDSVALCRNPQSIGAGGDSLPFSAAASGCATAFHANPTAAAAVVSSGCGTSTELAWELIDIFDSGMFAFPVYDHDSARDVVRYLLERGILEEEIADAIKDSAVDMNTWLERGDKYMVGEWVIAWINACRADYVRQKSAFAAGCRQGDGGAAPVAAGGLTDGFGRQCEPMDEDDDDDDDDGDDDGGDCAEWGGLREEKMEEELEEVEDGWCHSGADTCSSADSFRGAAATSYGSGLSSGPTGRGDLEWSPSSPPPTPFRRLEPFLRLPLDHRRRRRRHHHRHHHPSAGGGEGRLLRRRRALWWRGALQASSLQHLTQTSDDNEKSDSGIVSDMFDDATSRDDDVDVDDDVDYDVIITDVVGGTEDEEEQEQEQEEEETEEEEIEIEQDEEHQYYCTTSHETSLCSVVGTSNCSCRLPHYTRFPTPVSNAERCANCGKEKEEEEDEEEVTFGRHVIETSSTAQVPRGQYYKDFIIRALEYTLDTPPPLDRDGPGYLFVLVDSDDRPTAWTDARRFRVGSSCRPELCVAAYRSRGIQVDLLWQVLVVDRLGSVTADVQMAMERHRIHSSWFKCTLTVVMETVYDVIARHHQAAVGGCLGNEP